MQEQGNDWFELREFSGTDLLQSFVLSWEYSAGTLSLDIDVCLLPDHPFYEQPRPSEKGCIRAATLDFPYCTALSADAVNEAAADRAGVAAALGHGRISALKRLDDGQYRLDGRFGSVHIASERPLLRLKHAGA